MPVTYIMVQSASPVMCLHRQQVYQAAYILDCTSQFFNLACLRVISYCWNLYIKIKVSNSQYFLTKNNHLLR